MIIRGATCSYSSVPTNSFPLCFIFPFYLSANFFVVSFPGFRLISAPPLLHLRPAHSHFVLYFLVPVNQFAPYRPPHISLRHSPYFRVSPTSSSSFSIASARTLLSFCPLPPSFSDFPLASPHLSAHPPTLLPCSERQRERWRERER